MTLAIASGQEQSPEVINGAANAGTTSVQYEVATAGSTTSTTYTATLTGSTAAGGTFVAPPTGRVLVLWNAAMFLNVLASTGRVSWEIRAGASVGSGTIQSGYGADDSRSLRIKVATAVNHDQQWGASALVIGLTAGSTYNIRHMFKQADAAGTLSVVFQRITVVPAH